MLTIGRLYLQNRGIALTLNALGTFEKDCFGVESILSVPFSGRISNLWLIIAVKM